jgi:hypothetical protein
MWGGGFYDVVSIDATWRRTVGWYMNNELERMWKESTYSADICLEGLRKTTKTSVRVAGAPAGNGI